MLCATLLLASILYPGVVPTPDSIPYKAADEFELKLDFEFRERQREANKVTFEPAVTAKDRVRSSGPLPYLFLNFRVLTQQPDEARMRVIENNSKVVYNRKIDRSSVLKLELGFTDDIKDHIGPYEFAIVLLNEDKEPLRRVVIFFQTDGTYLVNGQVRGKI